MKTLSSFWPVKPTISPWSLLKSRCLMEAHMLLTLDISSAQICLICLKDELLLEEESGPEVQQELTVGRGGGRTSVRR